MTVQSVTVLPRSPLINSGSNPFGLATDMRGGGFPRTTAGAVTIGAVQGVSDIIFADGFGN
jgi:hypothetical protein